MARSPRTIDFNTTAPDDPSIRVIRGQKGKTEFRAAAPKKLVLRVSELSDGSITREWATRYKDGAGSHKRLRYGVWPEMDFKAAAAAHVETVKLLKSGIDPSVVNIERMRALNARETVAEAVEQYLTEYCKQLAPRTAKEYRRLLERHLVSAFDNTALADVNLELWRRWLREERLKFKQAEEERQKAALNKGIKRKERRGVVFTRLYWTVSSFLTWAATESVGIIKENTLPPPERMGFVKEEGKRRPMDDVEIFSFWNKLDDTDLEVGTKCALRLILLTGLRPSEVLSLRKRDINFEETWIDKRSGTEVERRGGVVRIIKDKKKKPLRVPLSELACSAIKQVIDSRGLTEAPPESYLFANKKDDTRPMAVDTLDKAMSRNQSVFNPDPAKEPLTPHNLRSTTSDLARQLDFEPAVIDAILGHADHTVAARHYSVWDSINQRADALYAVGRRISILSQTDRAPKRET